MWIRLRWQSEGEDKMVGFFSKAGAETGRAKGGRPSVFTSRDLKDTSSC